MTEEEPGPEWCIVGTLLPYPYSENSPVAHHRSQKIFPVGAKLYLRAIREAAAGESTAHRWMTRYEDRQVSSFEPTQPAYGEHLARVAAHFQRSLHGSGEPGSPG